MGAFKDIHKSQGAWLARWVEWVTLDPGVASLSPTWGVENTLKKSLNKLINLIPDNRVVQLILRKPWYCIGVSANAFLYLCHQLWSSFALLLISPSLSQSRAGTHGSWQREVTWGLSSHHPHLQISAPAWGVGCIQEVPWSHSAVLVPELRRCGPLPGSHFLPVLVAWPGDSSSALVGKG